MSERKEAECPREEITNILKGAGETGLLQDCYCLCSTATPATCNRKKLKTGQQDGEIRLKTTWGKKYACGKVKKTLEISSNLTLCQEGELREHLRRKYCIVSNQNMGQYL